MKKRDIRPKIRMVAPIRFPRMMFLAAIGLGLSAIVLHANEAQESMTVGDYTHIKSDYELVNQPYNQLPATLITPHIKWMQNPAWGELRVLVILPTWASREVVELKQRIPAKVSVIMCRSHREWAPAKGAPTYHEVDASEVDRIAFVQLNRPEKYDAILVGKLDWTMIPESIRQMILDQVATGCGLVLVSPNKLDEKLVKLRADQTLKESVARMVEGVPVSMLPLRDEKRGMGPLDIALAQHGQGRVVFLDYKDNIKIFDGGNAWRYAVGAETIALTPFVEDDPLYYDYYYALLGKALIWAARKEPDARIVAKTEMAKIDIGQLPQEMALFEISSEKEEAGEYSAHMELRNRDNAVVLVKDIALKAFGDKAGIALQIPRVRKGLYVADLWLKKGPSVVNWGSAPITIAGTDYLEAITTEKEKVARGEPIKGNIRLGHDLPRGMDLQVEVMDTFDRVVQRVKPSVKGRDATFTVEVKNPLSRLYTLAASVMDKNGVLEEKKAVIGIPDRRVMDFVSLMWSAALPTRTGEILREQCRRYDVDGYYDGVLFLDNDLTRKCAFNLARKNMVAQPYVNHIQTGWRDSIQQELASVTNGLYGKSRSYALFGTLGYSICEENFIIKDEAKWQAPQTLAEYQGYLTQKFGALENVNKIWSSSYGKWEDISMISLSEAKLKNRFPQWVQQELYKQDRFMTLHEKAAEEIRRGDPGARITLDCIGESTDFDWVRAAEFCQGGWASGLEPFVMYKPDAVYGDGIGCNPGQLDPFRMKYYAWRTLLAGGQIIFWWPIGFHQGLGSAAAFTPDASEPLLCFETMCQEVRKLHHGVGALLVQSTKVKDPIVMNYSALSFYASVLNRKEMTWENSASSFGRLLKKVGWTGRYVSRPELEGLQYGEEARSLILPYSQSMSEKEMEAVKRFAEAGGFVIADYTPALFDEYCRSYGKVELVKEGKEAACGKCGGQGRYEKATATVTAWMTCEVCAGAGKVMEGREVKYTGSRLEEFFGGFTPMNFQKRGKGATLYLGKNLSQPGDWEGCAKLVEQQTGLHRHFLVTDTLGNPRTDVVTALFTNGTSRFFCFLPEQVVADPPGPETIVKLPGKYHVYDVLRQEYLGYGDEFKSGAVPAVPKIFAGLPCKLEGMTLQVKGAKFRPGAEVKVTAELWPAAMAGAGDCVRFEVYDPAGKQVQAYTAKVVSTSGTFDLLLPLSFNERPGKYTVKAEEIISGVKAECEYVARE